MIRNLFILIALLIPTLASAQNQLAKLVSSIEDSKEVNNVIYTEKRDPSTRKVIKSTRVIIFSDKKLAKRLIDTIKKEREKAVSYKATNEYNSTVYQIEFDDNKGNIARYSLIQDSPSTWTFSVQTFYNAPRGNCKGHRRNSSCGFSSGSRTCMTEGCLYINM